MLARRAISAVGAGRASASAAAASIAPCYCAALAASSSSTLHRTFHSQRVMRADPAPVKGGGKVAGGGAKKKAKGDEKERAPMVVPVSMSEYKFDHLNVLKDYKAPDEKVTLRPDSAYPAWIWDQTPEPTWSDLLLADFESLPPTYQKKVFSIPRKQAIKRNNDLLRKG